MRSKMTVKQAQEWLESVKKWHEALSGDMANLNKLLHKLPADRPLDTDTAAEINRLLKEIGQPRSCPPIHN